MPIYEYECEKCGEEFEVEQRIKEDPLSTHDGCGGKVKRLISLTTFALRGNGWYSDHYGLKSAGPNSSSCAKGNCSGKSPTEAKTETKAKPAGEASTAKSDSGKSSGSSSDTGKAA